MNAVQPPEPRIEYCGCERPMVPSCVECGEDSHRVTCIGRGEWKLTPIPHPDCNEGLGWLPARECPNCSGEDEADSVARWRDHLYGCGNH